MHDLLTSKLPELREVCARRAVRRLDVFGSALRPDFDPSRSDLDFVVEFTPLTPHDHKEAYFGLLEDLRRLFGDRIDLAELEGVRNPIIRAEIDCTRANTLDPLDRPIG